MKCPILMMSLNHAQFEGKPRKKLLDNKNRAIYFQRNNVCKLF